jgi:hypothetical protein
MPCEKCQNWTIHKGYQLAHYTTDFSDRTLHFHYVGECQTCGTRNNHIFHHKGDADARNV